MNHAKVAATALEACMALGRPPSSDWFNKDYEILRKFAELLAAEVGIAQYQRGYEEGKAFEREQCAKVCDSRMIITPEWQLDQHYNQAASHCAHRRRYVEGKVERAYGIGEQQ